MKTIAERSFEHLEKGDKSLILKKGYVAYEWNLDNQIFDLSSSLNDIFAISKFLTDLVDHSLESLELPLGTQPAVQVFHLGKLKP